MADTNTQLFSKTAPVGGSGSNSPGKKRLQPKKSSGEKTLGNIDHNNMTKTGGAPSSHKAANRILKTTIPPPLRKYPGELRKEIKGTINGAIYAEDIEREEAEQQAIYESLYGIKTELTSEDLMRDKQYLKLDQSLSLLFITK